MAYGTATVAETMSRMAEIITIDGAGRVVIPAAVRRRHRLSRGTRLRLEEDGDRLVLEPVTVEAPTEMRDGILIARTCVLATGVDHRTVREGRGDRLADES